MTFFRRTTEFRRFSLSLPNINLFDTYFLHKSIHFYTIRCMAMFLEVLSKVNFRVLPQTWIISYYWLTPVRKTFWGTSYYSLFDWKEDHFCSSVVGVFPCSACFITYMSAHFHTVRLNNAIRFSTLFRMSGFLGHSSKWSFGSVVSFNIRQGLKC